MSDFYTASELAKYLKLNPATIHKYAKQNKFGVIKQIYQTNKFRYIFPKEAVNNGLLEQNR